MSTLRAVTVETTPPYAVQIGAGALSLSTPSFAEAHALIADEHVFKLYGDAPGINELPRHLLPEGEAAKTLHELERALDFLCDAHLDRASTVVVLGGGAATDLGGLAAAMYLRGISWVACPTTLLAMVDASVGGKTAVNLKSGKNLAGSFHQPSAVIADTSALLTQASSEYASGLGEVLKTALIEGEELFALLEGNITAVVTRHAQVMADVICRCVATKARIVSLDPHEAGPRKALNLGHTFAHAIEQVAGPGTIPHGVAVAAGCGLALRAAEAESLLADPSLPERFSALSTALGLPSGLDELRSSSGLSLPADALIEAMRHDKKALAGTPRFVLPRAAGDLAIDVELDPAALLS
jgi:3-dehydroquinate synthetase